MTYSIVHRDDYLMSHILLRDPDMNTHVSSHGIQSPRIPWYNDANWIFLSHMAFGQRFYNLDAQVEQSNLSYHPPINFPYDRDRDWYNYGTVLGLIGHISGPSSPRVKDYPVAHPQADGVFLPSLITDPGTSVYTPRGSNSVTSTGLRVVSPDSYSQGLNARASATLYYYTDYQDIESKFFESWYDGFSTLRTLSRNSYYSYPVELYSYTFHHESDENMYLDMSYRIRVVWYYTLPASNKYSEKWDMDVVLSIRPKSFGPLDDNVSGYSISYYTEIVDVQKTTLSSSNMNKATLGKWYHFYGDLPAIVVGHNLDGSTPESRVIEVNSRLDSAKELVESYLPKLRGSSVASTMEAYDNFKDWSGTNLIESLSELDQTLDLMSPQLKRSVADILDELVIHKPEDVPRFIKKPIDYLTSGYLLLKFGLEPLTSDLAHIGRTLQTTGDVLASHCNGRYHGKAVFDITLGRVPATLVVRSHIDVSLPPGNMLHAILPLQRVGLDPSLSSLWDLVPFSFALDWFTNIGSRLDYATTGLHMIVGHVGRYVHSYTVYIDINDLGLSGVGQFTYYRREVSHYFPHPKPSSMNFHDWLGNIQVPPLVAGSLLWQLLG
jgi:hypothetical protein